MTAGADIRAAGPGDYQAAKALLESAGLPTEGIPATLEGFLVAAGPAGPLAGVAGLERYGRAGLLRSVAVAPEERGTGLGLRLTQAVLDQAEREGINDLFLLTTTAERFFPRFGFERITRGDVPAAVQASVEFQGACPETAVIMQRSTNRR